MRRNLNPCTKLQNTVAAKRGEAPDKTVSSMDAATEPPGKGLRRVWSGASSLLPAVSKPALRNWIYAQEFSPHQIPDYFSQGEEIAKRVILCD